MASSIKSLPGFTFLSWHFEHCFLVLAALSMPSPLSKHHHRDEGVAGSRR